MSIQLTTFPRVLDQSPNDVFFEKPAKIQILENSVTSISTSHKIEVLIKELQEKGPFVAAGEFGPNSYSDAPFKLKDKVCDQDIYGWKPGAKRTDDLEEGSYVLILGAKKIVDREYVYYTISCFTLSEDITTSSYIKSYKPSETDTRVYVTSHQKFRECMRYFYPPKLPPKNSDEKSEREYAEKLSSIMPLDSIIDRGEEESKCKAIGQEIFEKYKSKAGGNSWAGKEAVQKICNSIVSIAHDGHLRKKYIERAWNGIGDNNWHWLA